MVMMTMESRPAHPLFEVLSRADVERIHAATLQVLEQTGVFVEAEAALDVFARGGCTVDRSQRIVRVPPQVTEAALASAPKDVVLHGREPVRDVALEPWHVTFTNFGEGMFLVDPRSGERREPRKTDVAAAALAIDALDEIALCERPLGAHDVAQGVAALHNADAILRNTTKHVLIGAQDGFVAERMVELQRAILGSAEAVRSRSILSFSACPVSPLKLGASCCEVILVGARHGVPLNLVSMAMAGGSSPVTLAGTLVTHNTEVLAGVVLAQLAQPGATVVYGSATTSLDLRLGCAAVGSPELALVSAAVAQLARRYGLPSFVAGGVGDGKTSDAQAGHEKTLTALLPALAGANVIFGLGMVESGLTFDFAQLVMDAEFARMLEHACRGIPVDAEHLALPDIAAVGPFGDFLTLDATLRHMREQSRPRLIDRSVHEEWTAGGRLDIYARAGDAARRILDEHVPDPLPDDVMREMDRVVAEAEAARR
ncbi:MAG: trimethylamine methyltransferase family protein [Thermoleophilia bacterium]|nr:trimethylamine methyltransferase family protein [Thermoleophilia bacterium]